MNLNKTMIFFVFFELLLLGPGLDINKDIAEFAARLSLKLSHLLKLLIISKD